VASASIPGVFEPVLIHVQQGGRMYDEMHVDGNVSASLFIAPAAAYFALLDQRSLDGARVYVLINGQIIDAPETTPFRLRPIVARTFSVALKHMSRAQVVAVDQFAEKYRMSVQSTYLPFDYPKYSSADFRASTMRPLFDYGARCAQSGRLWTTLDETMDTVAAAAPTLKRTPAVDPQVECPLRQVQFTAGGSAINGRLECRGADNRHAAYRGAATPGESMWKIRARSASLHFDHTVLAELIAWRWHQYRRAPWWWQPNRSARELQ
jgi:hypothetical protein